MFTLPPLPTWDALHPIAVHLPIGVLAAVPVLLVMSLCFGRVNKGIAGATLVMLLIGAGACVLATSTGDAAADLAAPSAEGEAVLKQHGELAELTRNLFLILAGVYLMMLLAAAGLGERLKRSGWVAAHLLYIVGYGFALLALVNTGHLGARLVHQYKVRAAITGFAPTTSPEQRDGGRP